MEKFSEFLVNNYIWFLVATLILLFALIGYIVDSKKKDKEDKEIKEVKKKTKEEETKESIKDMGSKTLNDVVNNSNPEVKEDILKESIESYDQPLIVEEEKKESVFNDENKTD